MAKIECEVEHTEQENDHGNMQQCTVVTCGECGHVERSWGVSEGSQKRCLILLKENCPRGETNFYVGDV